MKCWKGIFSYGQANLFIFTSFIILDHISLLLPTPGVKGIFLDWSLHHHGPLYFNKKPSVKSLTKNAVSWTSYSVFSKSFFSSETLTGEDMCSKS